jgi:hypothetical protein
LIRFVIVLLTSAAIIAGATWLASQQHWLPLPSFFFQTLILLAFSTLLIYRYLYKAEKSEFFVQLYLLTMTVKLLAYGVYNVFVVLQDKAGATANVVFFMAVYAIFTFLEITFLYRRISRF